MDFGDIDRILDRMNEVFNLGMIQISIHVNDHKNFSESFSRMVISAKVQIISTQVPDLVQSYIQDQRWMIKHLM
ncbi:MAG: hypothetical protein M1113_01700 [Candidatus Thermoplasmatota archaeon]|nr:hypothetical protein [Candidatus Thermoplasmatota archaeon]